MRKRTALCLIDVINEMSFKGSEGLVRNSLKMARRIKALKGRARVKGMPVIYINDNFGDWQSDFKSLVDRCISRPVPGRPIAHMLRPQSGDYFILKPKHSIFYDTPLSVLLWKLGITRLILTGVAANICVLFSASDAYMRDFELIIPSDCVASNTLKETRYALHLMKMLFSANTSPSRSLSLSKSYR